MLVLTRKFNERVLINPGLMSQITVTFIGLRNGEARLAFQAPKDVVIMREEVCLGLAKTPNRRDPGDAK